MSTSEEPQATPSETYTGLRNMALGLTPQHVGAEASTGAARPYGMLMETGYPKAVVTLATFASGDASLYFSNGGAILGGEGHESVRRAACQFVAASEHFLAIMAETTEYPLPGLGRTRFYVLTAAGIFTAEAGERDLGEGKNELSPLFHGGHRVITALGLIAQAPR
jgi:hypothetical protein